MIIDPGNKRPFRFAAKKMFLTYSQVPEEVTSEKVLLELQQVLDIKEYAIGEEYHKDDNKHFHAVLVLERKHDIRSPGKLSIHYEGKPYNCQCTAVRNLSRAVAYACKDGGCLTNMKRLHNGVLVSVQELLMNKARIEGVIPSLKYYKEHFPKQVYPWRRI